MGMHTCNILLSSSSVLLLWWSMVCVCVLSFFTCWLSFGWRSGTRRDACQLWTRWLAAMWRHLLWSVECGLFVFLFCFSFVFVCVCWCCLFFLIYFLSFNPALPSLSLFTCDSSLSYPGVRGCGWGQRQVGSIASCSCNLYPPLPSPPPACLLSSKQQLRWCLPGPWDTTLLSDQRLGGWVSCYTIGWPPHTGPETASRLLHLVECVFFFFK